MTNVVRELMNSRPVNDQSGAAQGVRVFSVYNNATPVTTTNDVVALFGTATTPDAMPNYGDTWPDSLSPTIRAYSVAVEKFDDNQNTWRVTWQYRLVSAGAASEPRETEPDYVRITADGGGEFVDTWRMPLRSGDTGTALSIPSNGDIDNENTTNIGGKKVDSAGDPASFLRVQTMFNVSENLLGQTNLSSYDAFVGRRNNATFLGATTGSVLYVGYSLSQVDRDVFELTHRFLRDPVFFHMVQQPLKDQNGVIPLDGGSPLQHASSVYWRQPFPILADFSTISSNF